MPPVNLPESRTPSWLLRRTDQMAVAGLCLFALAALAWYWIVNGGLSGRLIEIDRAEPLTAQFQVDVNTAELPELINIPDVGDTLGQRIIDYRQHNGPFQAIDELRHVKGIGAKTLKKIKPYLRIGIPTAVAEKTAAEK